MRAEVLYAGHPIGWIDWEPDAFGVQVTVDCGMPSGAPLLRCYGQTDGAPLLVGLPAPEGGRLRLRRHLSRETLRAAGCADAPTKAFYLAERPRQTDITETQDKATREKAQPAPDPAPREMPLRTGDSVLDVLLEQGDVRAERLPNGLRLRCPFAPDRPFALAPAFVLCRVQGDEAVLDWTKKDAADAAASEETRGIT